MTITEIKNAVQKLSIDEQKELFEWLDEFRDNQWDQQEETNYLLRSSNNAQRLLESIAELEAGKGVKRDLIE